MPEFYSQPKPRWYQRGWGVALIGLGAVVMGLVVIFVFLIGRYWWQIKHGQGENLAKNFANEISQNTDNEADRAKLEIADAPFLGNKDAKIVIVEFFDFKCSNCLLAMPIMNQVAQKYGNQVKIIMRNFPVESTHPGATQLAEMGVCANSQGNFWSLHNILFAEQATMVSTLSDVEIIRLAEKAGLDVKKFQTCLNSNNTTVKVNRDYVDGFNFGVAGTPTFFVNGYKVQGVVPLATWEDFLDKLK